MLNYFCLIRISEGGGKGEILIYSGVAVIWRKFLQFSSFVPEFQLRLLFSPVVIFLCLLYFPSRHRNPPNSSSESTYSFLLSTGLVSFNSSDYLHVCLLSNLLVETFGPSRGQGYSGHPCRDTAVSSLSSALLRVARRVFRVCAMHPSFFYIGYLRVSASYLSLLAFAFVLLRAKQASNLQRLDFGSLSPFVTVRALDYNSHDHMRAHPRKTREF